MPPKYYVHDNDDENWRLAQGSEVIRQAMGGALIRAPVDLSQKNLRILDSATGDGYQLAQIQATLPNKESATLIGTDIQDRFPKPPPPGIYLQIQDILQPWPEEWKGSFDLVRQHLCLSSAGPRQADVVFRLGELVKPGGWIQLLEPENMIAEDDGPAHKQWLAMLTELAGLIQIDVHFSTKLESYLKDAGFEDVQSERVETAMGAKVPLEELREGSIKSVLLASKNVFGAGKMIPGGFKCMTAEESESWPTRWEQELKTKGGYFPMRVAWGKKPRSSA